MGSRRDKRKRSRKRNEKFTRATLLLEVEQRLLPVLQRSKVGRAITPYRDAASPWEAVAVISRNADDDLLIDSRRLLRFRYRRIFELPHEDLSWVLSRLWLPVKPKSPLELLAECAE